MLVAELLERLRGERRAVAGRAVDDDLRLAVGRDALDPRLEVAAGDVDGARDVPLVPLVLLADVDHERRRVRLQRLGEGGRVDLLDLGS